MIATSDGNPEQARWLPPFTKNPSQNQHDNISFYDGSDQAHRNSE
jgi:hypothetical protein